MKKEFESMEFTGERFVPEVRGNIELEHMHRYLQACEIAGGKVVLDIASGEGYGSAMLAGKASKVIGVDISVEAVEHAHRRYKNENIEYIVGSCAAIPLPDATVDLVVSFETIEHHDQHEKMMQEIKRVLRPGGILLISSPDKYHYSVEPGYSNPYHIKELYQHEFKQLIGNYFKNVVYFGQRIMYGSGIFAETSPTLVSSYIQENEIVRDAPGIVNPVYWIALASDVQLPRLASGVLEQRISDTEISKIESKSWDGDITGHNEQSVLNVAVAEQSGQAVNFNSDVDEHDKHIANLNCAIVERDRLIAILNQAVADCNRQVANLSQITNELVGFQHEVCNSTLWKLSSPLRTQGPLFRNVCKFVLLLIRQGVIKAITFCYHRLPFPQSQKNLIKDFCYQHCRFLFLGVPSYELWVARKSTITPHFSSESDFNEQWPGNGALTNSGVSMWSAQSASLARAKQLAGKWIAHSRRYGVWLATRRAGEYLKVRLAHHRMAKEVARISGSVVQEAALKDFLIVNGCMLPHPMRYRVLHLVEQLKSQGVTCDVRDLDSVSPSLVKQYNAAVFFRCEWTEQVQAFIDLAREQNKPVFYDIDDLIFEKKYVDSISYFKSLNDVDAVAYGRHVEKLGKALRACDYGLGSTPVICEAMREHLRDVYDVGNVASEEMVTLSQKVHKKGDQSVVRIGYFSGSITHNPDLLLVLPVIRKIMERHAHVELLVVGYLDIPEELSAFSERIHTVEFTDWRKLPQMYADVDINLAPLESTIFNQGKSENKWTEAALVGTPTIASPVGGFLNVIRDGENGFLCEGEQKWYDCLERLVLDSHLRRRVGDRARKDVLDTKTTLKSARYIFSKLNARIPLRIGFVVPSTKISGGVNVILRHASILRKAGYLVTLVSEALEEDDCTVDGMRIAVVSRMRCPIEVEFDVLVATLWTTVRFVSTYGRVRSRLYLVQNYETDFYPVGDPRRLQAEMTYRCSAVRYITISRWCQRWLKERYGHEAGYAPNGLDRDIFSPAPRNYSGKIRVLVEGSSIDEYKNVDESFRIVNELDRNKFEIWYVTYAGNPKPWYRVDRFFSNLSQQEMGELYRSCHVLLKSSLLESFSYPPLEMMATGGVAVVAGNDGNAEYLQSGINALVYQLGDIKEARRLIELLIEDSQLRERLVEGGLHTARERTWGEIEPAVRDLYMGTLEEYLTPAPNLDLRAGAVCTPHAILG